MCGIEDPGVALQVEAILPLHAKAAFVVALDEDRKKLMSMKFSQRMSPIVIQPFSKMRLRESIPADRIEALRRLPHLDGFLTEVRCGVAVTIVAARGCATCCRGCSRHSFRLRCVCGWQYLDIPDLVLKAMVQESGIDNCLRAKPSFESLRPADQERTSWVPRLSFRPLYHGAVCVCVCLHRRDGAGCNRQLSHRVVQGAVLRQDRSLFSCPDHGGDRTPAA